MSNHFTKPGDAGSGQTAANESRRQARPLAALAACFPFVATVRTYRRKDGPHDLIAGLVLGVITVPQAIAYAFLAGLPAEAGLYACLLPMVVYALMGSSRQLVVGPVAIAALMVAATVGEFAPAYSEQYLAVTTMLCLEVGVFLLLLRLARMGGVVSLLSHPVIAGFVNAAAILIIVSQLGALVGANPAESGGALAMLAMLASSLESVDPTAVAVGAASLAVIWLTSWLAKRAGRGEHPLARSGPMLAAVVGVGAAIWLQLDIATVGFVPTGLPTLAIPPLDAELGLRLAPNAALIAVVAYVESYSVGQTLASKQRRRIDRNQELLALGVANISAGFSGAYPVAGSFSRSGVNAAAGGRTQVSVLVCAAVIVVTLLWLTSWFEHLPHATLAAIVVTSVWGLVDFRSLRQRWRFHRADVVAHFATLTGVLALGVEAGLLVGVGVSLALFLRSSSDPHMAMLGRLGDTPHFRNVERYAVATWPHLLVVRVDESIYFANADQIETRLLAMSGDDSLRHLVLTMSAVNFVDASGLEMLQRLAFRLHSRDVALHLCDVKGPVRDQLGHIDIDSWLSGRVFRTTDDAVNELTATAGAWVWQPGRQAE